MKEIKSGIELIAQERKRQIEVEGWTVEHDAEHDNFELSTAAICYAMGKKDITCEIHVEPPSKIKIVQGLWPWDAKWWKPSRNKIKNLIKAGALIAAEIDRLQNIK